MTLVGSVHATNEYHRFYSAMRDAVKEQELKEKDREIAWARDEVKIALNAKDMKIARAQNYALNDRDYALKEWDYALRGSGGSVHRRED